MQILRFVDNRLEIFRLFDQRLEISYARRLFFALFSKYTYIWDKYTFQMLIICSDNWLYSILTAFTLLVYQSNASIFACANDFSCAAWDTKRYATISVGPVSM